MDWLLIGLAEHDLCQGGACDDLRTSKCSTNVFRPTEVCELEKRCIV
jgi:hypothetical protein